MSRIEKIFWNGICAAAIFLVLCMAGSKLLTGWGSVCSYRVFFIMSGSMEPEIRENSFVIGKVVPRDRALEVGQVYAYREAGMLGDKIIIHRLIGVSEDGRYQFKGDSNARADERLVEREDVGYVIVCGKLSSDRLA